jgi:hypothetical protein
MADRGGQRYFKLTSRGRAPKVHLEWPAEEEIPWYYRYFLDFVLILIAIPLIYARTKVLDDGWAAYGIEMILVFIVLLVIQPKN